MKILTGNLKQLNHKLVTLDVWENRISSLDLMNLAPTGQCPACGERKFDFLEGGHEAQARSLCGRDAVQIWRTTPRPVDFESIAERLSRLGSVRYNDFLLRAQVEDFEIALFRDGRGIVRGTRDLNEAQRIYAKYIGN